MGSCPPDMVFVGGGDQFTNCSVRCPLPIYSDYKWDIVLNELKILNTISVVLLIVALVYWVKENRMFPKNLIMHFILAQLGWHFTLMVVSSWVDQKEIWCVDGVIQATQAQLDCGFEGSILLFFAWAQCMWWLILLTNMFFTIVIAIPHPIQLSKYYIIFGWGVGAVVVLIGLIQNRIGYSSLTSWCFIRDNDQLSYQWEMFFGPVCFILLLGFIFGCCVTFKIIRSFRVVRQHEVNPFIEHMNTKFNIKLMVLVVYFFLTVISYESSEIELSTKYEGMKNDLASWSLCQMTEFYQPNPDYSKCSFKILPTFWIYNLAVVLSSLSGTISFIVFCFSKKHIQFWKGLLEKSRKERARLVDSHFNFYG